MDNIRILAKQLPDEKVKASIKETLADATTRSEAGEITSVVLIMGFADGTWTHQTSEVLEFSKAIGRLEILKHEWITRHLAE